MIEDGAPVRLRVVNGDDAAEYRPGYTLPLVEFRRALSAVRPHCDARGSDLDGMLFVPGGTEVMLGGTDRYSLALAVVPVEDVDTDDADVFTLPGDAVAAVLAVFRLPADKDEHASARVRVSRHGEEVTVTDASGMLDGQSLTVPIVPGGGAGAVPDLRPLVGQTLTGADAVRRPPTGDRGMSKTNLVALAGSAKAANAAGWMVPSSERDGAAHVFVFDDWLVVVVMPVTTSGEDAPESPGEWRARWRGRLTGGDE